MLRNVKLIRKWCITLTGMSVKMTEPFQTFWNARWYYGHRILIACTIRSLPVGLFPVDLFLVVPGARTIHQGESHPKREKFYLTGMLVTNHIHFMPHGELPRIWSRSEGWSSSKRSSCILLRLTAYWIKWKWKTKSQYARYELRIPFLKSLATIWVNDGIPDY